MIKRYKFLLLMLVLVIALGNTALADRDHADTYGVKTLFTPAHPVGVSDVHPVGVSGRQGPPTIEFKNLKLRGTAISGLFKPIAIIEDVNTNENRWYKVGDTLCGGRITDIRRGAVVLEMNGSLYLFGLPEGTIEGFGTVYEEEAALALGEKIGDNRWKIELGAAIDMLTRINKIMKEARIRPYFAVGKAAGMRIDRIQNNSVIGKMGLEDGDIIKGVNGFGLLSPTKVFDAYRKYKNSRLIELQLIRDEKPVTLTYNIVK